MALQFGSDVAREICALDALRAVWKEAALWVRQEYASLGPVQLVPTLQPPSVNVL